MHSAVPLSAHPCGCAPQPPAIHQLTSWHPSYAAPAEWRLGRPLSLDGGSSGEPQHLHQQLPTDDSAVEPFGSGGDVELSGQVLKTYAAHGVHMA